jgi:1,2-diacylglycerol 3-alpha-glucosyltransferase
MRIGIVELYCGKSGKKGFYNNQEIGLARAMKKIGYDAIIFYPGVNEKVLREEKVEERIKIVFVPAKAVGNHSRYDWSVLLKYHIDVVQVGSDNQIFAPDLMHFCDKHFIKIYNYLGTVGSDSDKKIKKAIMKILFARNIMALKTHKCFVKTQKVFENLTKMGIENATVAPVGLDTAIIPQIKEKRNVLRKTLDLPETGKILLFVGRMDAYKRPLEALKMFRALPEDYYFVMIGIGELDSQVDEYLVKYHLKNRVIRIKKIPNAEIHKYYKAVDYYLNFNEQEIFGMSILEAMYQDCTVIAIKAPGPNEIISNKETGFLVENTEEMKTLLKDNVSVSEGAAKNAIINNFVWDKTAQKFDEWIRGE